MSKFEQYNIVLKDLAADSRTYEYNLDNEYFKKIDSPEVQFGNLKASVLVQKLNSAFELKFEIQGSITIPCDRCLDSMEQPILHKEKLMVKLGNEFSEEDEIVIVPESEGSINIAWFLYEFIVLNIPIKHVHAPGECNKAMVGKLKKHIIRHKDDEDTLDALDFEDDEDDDFSTNETQTDPRWDSLKDITDNN